MGCCYHVKTSNLIHILEKLPQSEDLTNEDTDKPAVDEMSEIIIVDRMIHVQQLTSKNYNIMSCSDPVVESSNAYLWRAPTREWRKCFAKATKSFVCVDFTPVRTSLANFIASIKLIS